MMVVKYLDISWRSRLGVYLLRGSSEDFPIINSGGTAVSTISFSCPRSAPLFVFTLGEEYYSVLSSSRAKTSVDECRTGLLILCLGKFLGSCCIGFGHDLSRIVVFNGTGKDDDDLAQLNLMH